MVYRGKPSKACHRCRKRKLKCDLKPTCGQCVRAREPCFGYRNPNELQVRDESTATRLRVLSKNGSEVLQLPTPPEDGDEEVIFSTAPSQSIISLPISLDVQAHEAFFNYYVGGISVAWEFVGPFHDAVTTPPHLRASINAVSLAFLAHQTSSSAAFDMAREKYAVALRETGDLLKSGDLAITNNTLLSSLLLDLYEKFMHSEPKAVTAYTGHIVGSLALVKTRGLDKFNDELAAKMLLRLSNNLLISCLASGTRPPPGLSMLREYARNILDLPTTPKWRLSTVMIDYAALRYDILTGKTSISERISGCIDIETRMQAVAFDIPPRWQWKTTAVSEDSPRIFHRRADFYTDRHATQTWNVSCLTRIMINEILLDTYAAAEAEDKLCNGSRAEGSPYKALAAVARNNIGQMAQQICFSVPQYVACESIRRGTLSEPKKYQRLSNPMADQKHSHHPEWNLDCYSLIYPLFVAGRTETSAGEIREWIRAQLCYMAEHFDIRNAATVASLLDRGDEFSPWDIYGMLGSYAFAA